MTQSAGLLPAACPGWPASRPPPAPLPPSSGLLLPASSSPPAILRPAPARLRLLPPPRSLRQLMAGPCSARLQGDVAAFTAALRTLVNNPQFSDVMFVVGQEQQKVFAHRCVLACRCQAFRGMLSQAPVGSQDSSSITPQGPFILGNVQPEVFLAVIEFLYTNSVTLNSHILCVKFIKDTLSVEQVCEALQAAVTYGQVDLQQHCLDFIEGCTAAVVRTQGFRELSDVVLARVLRSDRLAVDELDLVQAVREWAHVSSAVLERPVPEVAALPVRELRLPLLAPSELVTLESYNQQDLLIPVENIAAAWRAHALRRDSGVPSRLCRPRQGTRPRDHHRHLEPHTK
ncbi:BTB/POZ domain-containing protein 19 isoform X2 [Catharus ustulatus]|uniref:BTB/POZ domain-containing protein 19 isoform X2 n=1 Tax=Catharus ustulatus TaxID=91951 RepID=UPI00140D6FC5|nr:BTB/POZ domain-containing protein 19 isoform X2 [Catharus ustulatus]